MQRLRSAEQERANLPDVQWIEYGPIENNLLFDRIDHQLAGDNHA